MFRLKLQFTAFYERKTKEKYSLILLLRKAVLLSGNLNSELRNIWQLRR